MTPTLPPVSDETDEPAVYTGVLESRYGAWVENGKYQTLRAAASSLREENQRLKVMCNNSLANNLCPDHRDKQAGKPCLACETERLVKRLEKFNDERQRQETRAESLESRLRERDADAERWRLLEKVMQQGDELTVRQAIARAQEGK